MPRCGKRGYSRRSREREGVIQFCELDNKQLCVRDVGTRMRTNAGGLRRVAVIIMGLVCGDPY